MHVIRLPEIKTAELSTYGNFAKCHQAHFRVSRVGLGTRLVIYMVFNSYGLWRGHDGKCCHGHRNRTCFIHTLYMVMIELL